MMSDLDQLIKERDDLLREYKDSPSVVATIWQHFIEMCHKILAISERVTS